MKFLDRNSIIEDILITHNEPSYRKGQVFSAIYKGFVKTYDEITVLPKELRAVLSDKLGTDISTLRSISQVTDSQSRKVLFETLDKERVEAVLMEFKANKDRQNEHESLCISTQAGCAMGCKFCATGAIGLKRNLTTDEIVDQILYFLQRGNKVDSVSLMGMGEPFANPNIFRALEIITDKDKLGFSQRRVSISTVGVIPGIRRLQKEFPAINLGFSLHSPFPEQRLELMPIEKAYPITDVMKALKLYVEDTNKRVLIAYTLLADVNDTIEHAKALVRLIKNQGAKSYLFEVKLIQFNPGPTTKHYEKAKTEKIRAFQKILNDHGTKNTLRQSFGLNINAACGQLYADYEIRKPVV